jgi:hypothetical protein
LSKFKMHLKMQIEVWYCVKHFKKFVCISCSPLSFNHLTQFWLKYFVSRMYFLDNVQQDLQTLGVRNWKEIASDRIRWRGIVKAVLAWIGL